MGLNRGKLVCRYENTVWIAAVFEWEPQDSKLLSQAVDLDNDTRRGPNLISQFEIEMTLTKQRSPTYPPQECDWRMNASLLSDDAFLPKSYTVKLERGKFITPHDARRAKEIPFTPRYTLRLIFDNSPYPPRHEWKDPVPGPDATKMWEWKEFCGRQLPLTEHGDTDAWWSRCVVS